MSKQSAAPQKGQKGPKKRPSLSRLKKKISGVDLRRFISHEEEVPKLPDPPVHFKKADPNQPPLTFPTTTDPESAMQDGFERYFSNPEPIAREQSAVASTGSKPPATEDGIEESGFYSSEEETKWQSFKKRFKRDK